MDAKSKPCAREGARACWLAGTRPSDLLPACAPFNAYKYAPNFSLILYDESYTITHAANHMHTHEHTHTHTHTGNWKIAEHHSSALPPLSEQQALTERIEGYNVR